MKLTYGVQARKRWDNFYGGSEPLKTPCKDFNLAIAGGLGAAKTGAGNSLYFMQLFPDYILFGENLVGDVIVPLYSVCLNLTH